MGNWKSLGAHILLGFAATSLGLYAQAPGRGGTTQGDTVVGTAKAVEASKEDPAAVDRGGKLYTANCAGCHGATAKGGPGAPDLIRSLLVLDDEKGILIAPVLRDGRPDKGMPNPSLTEPQISDIVAWLHVQTYAAGHRVTYSFQNVLTGDAKKGEVYFKSTCGSCHSATGDLAGIGKRFEPYALQTHWLQPKSDRVGPARAGVVSRSTTTVKVTLPSGESFSGALDRIDDFIVSLHDANGEYRSFSRDGNTPRVEINNPFKAHTDLLSKYTDADIHNVTAYLVTLK